LKDVQGCSYVKNVNKAASSLRLENCNEVYSVSEVTPKIKFDSAASRNMSGDPTRISIVTTEPQVIVQGFNGSKSMVDAMGINLDGKKEYYISSMPHDLVLLSANDYVQGGAAILYEDGGVVLNLDSDELEQLKSFIEHFTVFKELTVNNRTYEVIHQSSNTGSEDESSNQACEEAYSNTATRYFNSAVHVSNHDERILATLLSGPSFKDTASWVQHNLVDGLPRDLTMKSLNSFSQRFGTTPNVIQMSTPNLGGNKKGYFAPEKDVSIVGEVVEADFFYSDFNIRSSEGSESKKLPTHGGATSAFLVIDKFSGFVYGELAKAPISSLVYVQRSVKFYQRHGHRIHTFVGDGGVLPQKHFRVLMTDVESYLENENISTRIGEAYKHDRGLAEIEHEIRSIKELIRFAVIYVLQNPNFSSLGFTKTQILMLWGELFYWALTIQNLKLSFSNNAT
jgi:hypothetical protein